MLINGGEVGNWILRCQPSDSEVTEVIEALKEILEKAPDIGLRIPVFLGTSKYTMLTESCATSITWSLLTEYGDWPRGVYLYQIESRILENP